MDQRDSLLTSSMKLEACQGERKRERGRGRGRGRGEERGREGRGESAA